MDVMKKNQIKKAAFYHSLLLPCVSFQEPLSEQAGAACALQRSPSQGCRRSSHPHTSNPHGNKNKKQKKRLCKNDVSPVFSPVSEASVWAKDSWCKQHTSYCLTVRPGDSALLQTCFKHEGSSGMWTPADVLLPTDFTSVTHVPSRSLRARWQRQTSLTVMIRTAWCVESGVSPYVETRPRGWSSTSNAFKNRSGIDHMGSATSENVSNPSE